VVGESTTAAGQTHAFLWRGGHMTDLGTLGGSVSSALAINNHDAVVGYSLTASGVTHAFLWRSGHLTDLGGLPGQPLSVATGINDSGEVVGQLGGGSSAGSGFIWRNGVMRRVPGSGNPGPTGVNSRGDICAVFNSGPGAGTDAVIYVHGRRILVRKDAQATAVNDFGAVAGSYIDSVTGETAYLWHLSTRTFVPLGKVPGSPDGLTEALGNNNHRQVAGHADVPDSTRGTIVRAVLWTSDGRPHLLPGVADGLNAGDAHDVNNAGQLAGQLTLTFDPPTFHAALWAF
jgi:probable HAF family extracellular repeat protein